MAGVRRVRTMPVVDEFDRCDRCGKRLAANAERTGFLDRMYDRVVRACGKCAVKLRMMSGYEEREAT